MSTEPIFDAVIERGTVDLSDVVCWLTLSPTEWCVIGGHAANSYAPPALYDSRLEIAADREPGSSLLADLAAEGFAVQVNDRTQVAQAQRPGSGHRLQIVIHYGTQFQAMPGRADRRLILGQCLPVASLEDVTDALLWQRADGGMREQTEAEMHLFRLSEQHAEQMDSFLPPDLRERAEADRARALAYPDGDGWGEPLAA